MFAVVALLVSLPASLPASADQETLDARIAAVYRSAYNLEHDTALSDARALIASAPNESRVHRTLAGILWLQALFHRGAVTVDHYMGGLTRTTITLPKTAPEIEREFRTAVTRAIELAEARLKTTPANPEALYDVGAAHGLQASWIASVDGNVRAAFRTARRAYLTQEKVLEVAPDRVSAGAVVGTYRYAVAGLGLASRLFAYVAGFSGGKEAGIRLLEAASVPGSISRFEARTALVLIYSREGRHQDAFHLLSEMHGDFPDNRILVLERGAAAIRAGRAQEAETILTSGIRELDADQRRKLPGERALWFYRRGLARLALGQRQDATADLKTALGSGPEEWIRGRTELALGQLDDLAGRRNEALVRYRRARDIARAANDPAGLADANRLIRTPFVLATGHVTTGQTVHAPGTRHLRAVAVV